MSVRTPALVALILLISLVLAGAPLAAAPLQQGNEYNITSPAQGATVSGVVEVVGTVTHPNFVSYGVLYAAGPEPTGNSQWVEIVFGVQNEVTNSVLATWDTAARTEDGQPVVPNGVYTLALARYKEGSDEPDVSFVRNITVNNEEELETPTPTLTPLPTAVPGTPTAVPIDQPPTATPLSPGTAAPGETPVAPPPGEDSAGGSGEVGAETETEGGGEVALDTGRLRGAFFDGVKIALLLFVLWGLYVVGKAAFRYYLRTQRTGPPGRK